MPRQVSSCVLLTQVNRLVLNLVFVSQDSDGHTPLHIAIQNQHPSIIALLLCHPSIDLSLRDKTGLSPFAAALTVRNHKAAEAILDKMPNAAEQVCDNFLCPCCVSVFVL